MPRPQELFQQALAFHRAGDLGTAESLYRQTLSLDPNHADAHHFLGTLAHQCNQDDLAIQLLQRALQLKPGSPRTYNNLGEAFRALDRLDEAARCFSTAISLVPTYAEAHQNLGVVLAQQLKLDAALASYDRAIQLQPDNAEAHTNRALVFLQRGQWERGWSEYEWRHRRPEYRRDFPTPQWDGSPLQDRTLLIWSEQGFGDTIQFSRFLPQLLHVAQPPSAVSADPTQPGAAVPQVIFECQRELRPLFENMPGLQGVSQGEPLPQHDIQCALMSLPKIFGTTPQSIPSTFPYIAPPPQRLAQWRDRLPRAPETRRIGLAWASNALNPTARRRSCHLADFAPLANTPGARFISLQKGPAAAEAANPPSGMKLLDLTDELHDFADTAALIAQLDLVIAVDTAVAHLAGAMNKPVWVLLPLASDWRWLLNREDSPWYPTARLFRQSKAGEWAGVVQRVLDTIKCVM